MLLILVLAGRWSIDSLGDDGRSWDATCALAEIEVAVGVIAIAHTAPMCPTLWLALILKYVFAIDILLVYASDMG